MSPDINLFYHGASGGFFCLHLLLLTNEYSCIFKGPVQDFKTIFQHQWNIKNISTWKATETWPDNQKTLSSNINNKIFFHCGNSIDVYNQFPGIKVILYTDVETQLYLAKTKTALWFKSDVKTEYYQSITNDFLTCYNNIKSDSWPCLVSLNDFNKLPHCIQQECNDVFNFYKTWDFKNALNLDKVIEYYVRSSDFYIDDTQVYKDLEKYIIKTEDNIVIKYQELIKTNGDILFDQLGITGNQVCKDFVKMYIDLHTYKQKKFLLK